ncbi:MAG: AtpZ/AtpI family protein [Deltaproteobacteria bacterium]|nr:AtpZ/AtpI family protein [Deltaproteobacteria bacterium]MBM4323174.1 AtpZ/AtpI family protein [Deltaproteobacteria bacterium]
MLLSSVSSFQIIISERGANRFPITPKLEVILKEWVKPVQFLMTVGWYVALSLIIPVGIGYWLDRPGMLNKSPLFTLIGLGIGTVIAFAGLIRMLIRYQAEQEKFRKNRQNHEQSS